MKRQKIVAALGQRALGATMPEQKKATRKAAKTIAELAATGAELVITHSNAQQVGMIHTAFSEFSIAHPEYTTAPMSVVTAMSQGYIGYDLQNAIRAELLRRGIYKNVATILTQVEIDPYDDALYEPIKKIGRVLNEKEAEEEEEKGNYVVTVEGGYRRIVPAPKPQSIVELDAIRLLSDAGQIVIAGGGGGIAVMPQETELRGASAVIEKDRLCGLLAEELNADVLLILTSVDYIYTDYGTDHQAPLARLSVAEAKKLIAEGEFDPATVLPKIEAAISFVEKGYGRKAIITSLERGLEGVLGRCGTIIS